MGKCTRASVRSLPSGRDGPPVVLGIDPGLERTGYALLSEVVRGPGPRVLDAGIIRLVRYQPLERRLVQLDEGLTTLIATYRPRVLACEELYAHYRHPRTAILMGHARGVILAAAGRHGMAVLPLAATHVKKILTGSGRASKQQVQRAVANTLGLPALPGPHDVADAIAIALCGLWVSHRSAIGEQPAAGER